MGVRPPAHLQQRATLPVVGEPAGLGALPEDRRTPGGAPRGRQHRPHRPHRRLLRHRRPILARHLHSGRRPRRWGPDARAGVDHLRRQPHSSTAPGPARTPSGGGVRGTVPADQCAAERRSVRHREQTDPGPGRTLLRPMGDPPVAGALPGGHRRRGAGGAHREPPQNRRVRLPGVRGRGPATRREARTEPGPGREPAPRGHPVSAVHGRPRGGDIADHRVRGAAVRRGAVGGHRLERPAA